MESSERTRRGKEQRWSHQEEPGEDSGFKPNSATLKPIKVQPGELYRNISAKIHFSLERWTKKEKYRVKEMKEKKSKNYNE